ncbi:MAG: hypothetical protein ACKOW8_05475, partial [Flavobacteriales bacterium]
MDSYLTTILKVGILGWPTADKQLSVRPQRAGERPGEIGGFYIDPLDNIHVFNKSNHQIEVYEWQDEPLLIYSWGHPGGGSGGINDVEFVAMDPRSMKVYICNKNLSTQKVVDFLIPPPSPSGDIVFNVVDGKLVINFAPVKSVAVSGYGLKTTTNRGDSIVSRSTYSSLTIPEMWEDDNLHYYDIISLNWSDVSDKSIGFYDYLNYAEALMLQHKYQEAFGSFILAAGTIGKQSATVTQHIAKRMSEATEVIVQDKNFSLALEYMQEAYRLHGSSAWVQERFRSVLLASFFEWVAENQVQLVLSRMKESAADPTMQELTLSAADTLARFLSLQNNLNGISDAIKIQKKLVELKLNPFYFSALGDSYYRLYKYKNIREASE